MKLLYKDRLANNLDIEQKRVSKIKQANSGVPKSYMHRKHLSEARLKNSLKYSGINNGFYNKHHIDITKQIIRDANSKKVKMYNEQRDLVQTFTSGVEASKRLIQNNYCTSMNINSSISQSIKEPFKRTTCGFYWSR